MSFSQYTDIAAFKMAYCYSAPVWVQSIVINQSVYLRPYLWNHWTDLHEILCADPPWSWLGHPRMTL